jgi:hypothetical protein
MYPAIVGSLSPSKMDKIASRDLGEHYTSETKESSKILKSWREIVEILTPF